MENSNSIKAFITHEEYSILKKNLETLLSKRTEDIFSFKPPIEFTPTFSKLLNDANQLKSAYRHNITCEEMLPDLKSAITNIKDLKQMQKNQKSHASSYKKEELYENSKNLMDKIESALISLRRKIDPTLPNPLSDSFNQKLTPLIDILGQYIKHIDTKLPNEEGKSKPKNEDNSDPKIKARLDRKNIAQTLQDELKNNKEMGLFPEDKQHIVKHIDSKIDKLENSKSDNLGKRAMLKSIFTKLKEPEMFDNLKKELKKLNATLPPNLQVKLYYESNQNKGPRGF